MKKKSEVRCTRCGIILAGRALRAANDLKHHLEATHGYKSSTVCATNCVVDLPSHCDFEDRGSQAGVGKSFLYVAERATP